MIRLLNFVLRLTIWLLLTDNFSLENIVIGVVLALILPFSAPDRGTLKDWLRVLWEIAIAIPQAYLEAVEMILRPHQRETIKMERVKPGRSPGLIFLDIFLITFTPKTIVVNYHESGWYEVHWVKRSLRRTED
jgi:multicomponent Na+:H+ antiporter subunit E